MSQQVAGLHLVLGDEELLVERAVAAVLRDARKQAGTDDVPVNRCAPVRSAPASWPSC